MLFRMKFTIWTCWAVYLLFLCLPVSGQAESTIPPPHCNNDSAYFDDYVHQCVCKPLYTDITTTKHHDAAKYRSGEMCRILPRCEDVNSTATMIWIIDGSMTPPPWEKAQQLMSYAGDYMPRTAKLIVLHAGEELSPPVTLSKTWTAGSFENAVFARKNEGRAVIRKALTKAKFILQKDTNVERYVIVITTDTILDTTTPKMLAQVDKLLAVRNVRLVIAQFGETEDLTTRYSAAHININDVESQKEDFLGMICEAQKWGDLSL